jgi:hypothetical protein
MDWVKGTQAAGGTGQTLTRYQWTLIYVLSRVARLREGMDLGTGGHIGWSRDSVHER